MAAASAPSVKCCVDFNQEIEQAARWARAMFEHQRSRSIGVFVPDLSRHQALVQRTFEQVFYPSSTLHGGFRDGSVFHLAAGVSLRNHPLTASALLLLELAHSRIQHADASAIIRCPFIAGAASERSARALADLRLRRLVSLTFLWLKCNGPLRSALALELCGVRCATCSRIVLIRWNSPCGAALWEICFKQLTGLETQNSPHKSKSWSKNGKTRFQL